MEMNWPEKEEGLFSENRCRLPGSLVASILSFLRSNCYSKEYRRQCQPLPCLVLCDDSGLGSALKGVISSLDISTSRSIFIE